MISVYFIHRNIALPNIDTWTFLHPGISSVVGEATNKFLTTYV